MKISTKGRYGLRAVIDLAAHQGENYIPLKSIAERQNLSLNYLEHSFSALKKAGVVCGRSGPYGGYRLALPPEKTTVEQVLRVLEGDLSILPVSGTPTKIACYVKRMVWDEVDRRVEDVLSSVVIADLI